MDAYQEQMANHYEVFRELDPVDDAKIARDAEAFGDRAEQVLEHRSEMRMSSEVHDSSTCKDCGAFDVQCEECGFISVHMEMHDTFCSHYDGPPEQDASYEAYRKSLEEDEQRAKERRNQTPPMNWGDSMSEGDGYFCLPEWERGDLTGFHPHDVPPCDPNPRGHGINE